MTWTTDLADWESIRRLIGPKGTYAYGTLSRLGVDAIWHGAFRQQAKAHKLTVRCEGGVLYLDRED